MLLLLANKFACDGVNDVTIIQGVQTCHEHLVLLLILPLCDFQRLFSPVNDRKGQLGREGCLSELKDLVSLTFDSSRWEPGHRGPGHYRDKPHLTGATAQPALGQPSGVTVGLTAAPLPSKPV